MAAALTARAQAPAGKGPEDPSAPQSVENSVVRYSPRNACRMCTGRGRSRPRATLPATGVVIEGRRILTNAHAVLYASEVQVQAEPVRRQESATGAGDRGGHGPRRAESSNDDSFFSTLHSAAPAHVRPAEHPGHGDRLTAIPVGGMGISSTKGIVSRIEFVPYFNFTSDWRPDRRGDQSGQSGGPPWSATAWWAWR